MDDDDRPSIDDMSRVEIEEAILAGDLNVIMQLEQRDGETPSGDDANG